MKRATLEEAIVQAPDQSGVYLFKDNAGQVLYVGKAKSLRQRLRSYLRPEGDGRFQIAFLGRKASQVECVVTLSEGEALLLEDNLVKQHKPPYNVRLKDDKSFLMLRLKNGSPFPRLETVRSRNKKEEGYRYFGPYPSSHSLRSTLRLIHELYPLRDCTDQMMSHRSRPCLKHQIGRCSAPCVNLVTADVYVDSLEGAVAILEGKTAALEKDLEKRMKAEAGELRFEKARILRDQLEALRQTTEKRPVQSKLSVDRDVFGIYREEKRSILTVLRFRGGKLVDSKNHPVPSELPDEELVSGFLSRFYVDSESIPAEVVVPCEVNDREMLETWLSSRASRKVAILHAQKGEKFSQLNMAQENAKHTAIQSKLRGEQDILALEQLRERLNLTKLPEVIDCFDISEMQGANIVASRVRFVGGRPHKNGYRRYKIQSVQTQDDFASMLEVVTRSLQRGVEEDDLPDLIVIDGGKGQLSSALAARDEVGAWDVEMVGLAKDRQKERDGEKFRTGERVFLPGADEPIPLPSGSPERLLMERIRDEAHRFAITFHRKKREAIRSELDGIPGLGEARKKRLLRYFGSVQSIREASVADMAAVQGVSSSLAETIFKYLQKPGPPS